MVDDVVSPSNLQVMPVEKEELEKASLDTNVSKQSRNEDLFRKEVHIRINQLTWDRQLSPNPHALTIYLEFVPARG